MNYEELKNAFYEAIDNPAGWQHISHFFKKIKQEDPSVVLDMLMSIFIEKSDRNFYFVQEVAGGFLWKLKPKYKRNIKEDIRNVLVNWDVSVEELPWYFADKIGIESLKTEVNNLLKDSISEIEQKKANTILYWLKTGNVEGFKQRLNEKCKKIRG